MSNEVLITHVALNYISIGLLLLWSVQSAIWINKVRTKDINSVNPYLYNAIPSVFTTLGVLGTFTGILFALYGFDPKDIDGSIPTLLEGMRTAFITSVLGIMGSLVFGRISKFFWNESEVRLSAQEEDDYIQNSDSFSSEFDVLVAIHESIESSTKSQRAGMDFIAQQVFKLDERNNAFIQELNGIKKSLNSLRIMEGFEKTYSGQHMIVNALNTNVKSIIISLEQNKVELHSKFDYLGTLMAKSNTEALVNVMKSATQEFNRQMTQIIDRLVQENFNELNESVKNMVQWQSENKKMITQLTEQFFTTSKQLKLTSDELQKLERIINTLVGSNGKFAEMIKELEAVLVNDHKLLNSTKALSKSTKDFTTSSAQFKDSSDQLMSWVNKQKEFNSGYEKVLTKLEEVEKIKDYNREFWRNTKKQMNEGVSIVKEGSQSLRKDLDKVNDAFYDRLNDTLESLDQLIKRIITNYDKRLR